MNRKIVITYWWKADNGEEIKPSHIEALEETAEQRINEMRADGFTAGELIDSISMDDDDPEDGVSYSGWWESRTTNE